MEIKQGCSGIVGTFGPSEEIEKPEEHNNSNCFSSVPSPILEAGFWSELPEDIKVDILSRLEETVHQIPPKLVSQEWNFLISKVCVRRFSSPSPLVTFYGAMIFAEKSEPESDEEEEEEGEVAGAGSPKDDDKLEIFYLGLGQYVLVHVYQLVYGMPTILDKLLASIPPKHKASDILDCCNGLFLVASQGDDHQLRRPIQYCVCNPLMMQHIAVPVNPSRCHTSSSTSDYHDCYSSLLFDPSNYITQSGCNNYYDYNYKIIRFIRTARDATVFDPMELDIFSSETGQWSSHVVPVLEPRDHIIYGFEWKRRSVYWNGIVYFLSLAGYLVCINIYVLLRVDGEKDSSKAKAACFAVELPDKETITETTETEFRGCIGISSGCFYYFNCHNIISKSERRPVISVWMLVGKGKENCFCSGSQWVLRHRINTDEIVIPRIKLPKYALDASWPFAFHPSNDIIYMAAPQALLCFEYNFITKDAAVSSYPCTLRRVVFDQNLIFPYSECRVALNSFGPLANHEDH